MRTRVSVRLVLYEGETHRLDHSSAGVRVRDGAAWVSYAGRDAVLSCGEELRLEPGRDYAVISALGRSQLVLEVLAAERRSAGSMLLAPQRNTVACEGC